MVRMASMVPTILFQHPKASYLHCWVVSVRQMSPVVPFHYPGTILWTSPYDTLELVTWSSHERALTWRGEWWEPDIHVPSNGLEKEPLFQNLEPLSFYKTQKYFTSNSLLAWYPTKVLNTKKWDTEGRRNIIEYSVSTTCETVLFSSSDWFAIGWVL